MQNKYFQVLREMVSHKKTWFKLIHSFHDSEITREMMVSSNGFWFCENSPRPCPFFGDTLTASIQWKASCGMKWEGTKEDFLRRFETNPKFQGLIKKIKEVDGKEWEGFPDSLRKEIAK
jgi:hypothetical protein